MAPIDDRIIAKLERIEHQLTETQTKLDMFLADRPCRDHEERMRLLEGAPRRVSRREVAGYSGGTAVILLLLQWILERVGVHL